MRALQLGADPVEHCGRDAPAHAIMVKVSPSCSEHQGVSDELRLIILAQVQVSQCSLECIQGPALQLGAGHAVQCTLLNEILE